jgi:hypothetical protein
VTFGTADQRCGGQSEHLIEAARLIREGRTVEPLTAVRREVQTSPASLPAGNLFDTLGATTEARAVFQRAIDVANSFLSRIHDLTRHTYLLGYVPTNRVLDGKLRAVTVKVSRPNVTAMYPRAYTASAGAPRLDVREVATRERLRDAAGMDTPADGIKIDAKASTVRAPDDVRRVRVEMTIDASRLTLRQAGGRYEGIIDLMILCADSRQEVVGSLSQQMTMSLDGAHYRQAIASGKPYGATVQVRSAATVVKVLVYDYEADLLGTASVRIR